MLKRLSSLRLLAAMRCGGLHGRLPDDRHGRNMLKAMLAVGITGPEATRRAPWIKPEELARIIGAVDAAPHGYWDGKRLGELVDLTDAEREAGKLWWLWPSDVDPRVIVARVRERKRVRDRERARKKRDARKMLKDLDVRSEALFAAVGPTWVTVSQLRFLADGNAWKAPDGRPLAEGALRVAIHRSVDRLVRQGLVETRLEPGRRGPVRKIRRYNPENHRFVGNIVPLKNQVSKRISVSATSRRVVYAGNARKQCASTASEGVAGTQRNASPRKLEIQGDHPEGRHERFSARAAKPTAGSVAEEGVAEVRVVSLSERTSLSLLVGSLRKKETD